MQWCGYRLGSGGNSGFQAVNLAAIAGAKRIVLTGFDMNRDNGVHWHGAHEGLNNPDAKMLRRCANLLDHAAHGLRERGVEVLNASRETALTAYCRVRLEDVLK